MIYKVDENNKVVVISIPSVLNEQEFAIQHSCVVSDGTEFNYVGRFVPKYCVVEGVVTPDLENFKAQLIKSETRHSNVSAPVTYNGVTYKGGDSSAAAIQGAVELAQSEGETDVEIWDVNSNREVYTFAEALGISAHIAKVYREKAFAAQDRAVLISTATLESIETI